MATPAEKRYCIETMMEIMDDIPYNYAKEVQHFLAERKIEKDIDRIRRAKRLAIYDKEVVEALFEITLQQNRKPADRKTSLDIKTYLRKNTRLRKA